MMFFCLTVSGSVSAEESKPLLKKHLQNKVSCFDCHGEEKPTQKAVASESCMVCHGDYPAMADYTKNLAINPHKALTGKHPGPFNCTDCHKQHKAPVVKCLECHPSFKMTAK